MIDIFGALGSEVRAPPASSGERLGENPAREPRKQAADMYNLRSIDLVYVKYRISQRGQPGPSTLAMRRADFALLGLLVICFLAPTRGGKQ